MEAHAMLIRRVRKSPPVVVRPSEPVTTTGIVDLSPFDRGALGAPVTSLLVFRKPVHEPAETIKRALSYALVPYHPIAGRLAARHDDGQPTHIRCSGEGVAFVAASANCGLEEIGVVAVDQSLLGELVVVYQDERCSDTDTLLQVQVTEFSCGGFVVGVTWNHVIADAVGMGQFLNAIGELARGISPLSVAPVRALDELCLPASMRADTSNIGVTVEPGLVFTFRDITFPASLVSRIREDYRRHNGGESCTMFEAVTAVLWQCRTRAVMAGRPADAPILLVFAFDARRYMGVKDGYYGNGAVLQSVAATCGAVADGCITDVVKMMKHAKGKIPCRFTGGDDQPVARPRVVGGRHLGAEQLDKLLFVSSWQNLGFDKVDFGGGRPSRVIGYLHHPSFAFLPGRSEDGACYVSSWCVRQEHADAFLAELARFTSSHA